MFLYLFWYKSFLNNLSILINKRKLQEYYSKGKKRKYEKHIDILNQNPNFRAPGEYMATYGLKHLIKTIEGRSFRSALIPEILEYAFGFDMSEKVNKHPEYVNKNFKETFEIMRELRNGIGHGDSGNVDFKKVMDLIRFQRKFATKIDEHLVNNFFIIEKR